MRITTFSALLNGICIKHNKAMFTIPIHRAIPVLITVDKGELYVFNGKIMIFAQLLGTDNTEQNQNYSILVECHQPFILLKVIQALYMRLSFMCDRKGIQITSTITLLLCGLYLQFGSLLFSLEVFSDGHNNLNDEIHQLEKAFDRLSEACNSMTLELVD
jgi:hypothetical protein